MYFALLKVTQLRTIYEKSLITEQYTELNAYLEKKHLLDIMYAM